MYIRLEIKNYKMAKFRGFYDAKDLFKYETYNLEKFNKDDIDFQWDATQVFYNALKMKFMMWDDYDISSKFRCHSYLKADAFCQEEFSDLIAVLELLKFEYNLIQIPENRYVVIAEDKHQVLLLDNIR